MIEGIRSAVLWCNANQGFAMVMLTTVYVFATIGIALLAARANRISQRNVAVLTELERERTRPFVSAEVVATVPFLSVRIANRGQTAAFNIRVSTTPTLRLLLGGENAIPKEREERPIGFVEHGIGSLAPTEQIDALVGTFSRIKETNPELIYRGEVAYESADRRAYTQPVVLDVRYMENSLHVNRKGLHDIATELEKLQREISHIATGFSKPFVITQSAKEQRAEIEALVDSAKRQKPGSA